MKLFAAVVSCLLLFDNVMCQNSDEQREDAVENSANILTDLYVTLRNIAFPKSPLSDGISYNRFVLMSPGKVLNYWDYFPGHEYEDSLKSRSNSAPEALVPPAVMEKWFDISDVMVGADPFTGGITARSMARSYETILSQIELLNLGRKTSDAEGKYNMAVKYLTSQVQDPDTLAINTTRLSLYDRYQNEYATKRLEMEEEIDKQRRSRGAIDYQLWFQRSYPSLNSRIEGAYIKWLTFGQKDVVELYKTYLDSGSSGVEVQEARMSLRASGVSSLDRTRTVYPVSFEPGNWYKYLLPKKRGFSRDMLIARKSMLQSEVSALQSMVDFNKQNKGKANETLGILNANLNRTTHERDDKARAAASSMMDCISENVQSNSTQNAVATDNSSPSACDNFKKANEDAVSATFQQAQVKMDLESASFLLNSNEQFNNFLGMRISNLQSEITAIDSDLESVTDPYLGGVADSSEFQNLNSILNETGQDLDDEWTGFEYDSDSSHVDSDEETNSMNVAAGFAVGVKGLAVQASANYAKGTTDMKKALNSANLKVSGELLRVVIKRPWFRPEIFTDPSLYFVQRDEKEQKNTYVSPGPKTEKELRDAVGGMANGLYLLPEYVTSFLLARDVKLQFSGVDSSTVGHFMQMSAGGSLSGSYEMYSLSASVGFGKTKQSVTADRTANGMIITIPGAQVIGYYTEVMPRFPQSQN